MFQNSFQNIERQKHYRNFWGDRSELWPSICLGRKVSKVEKFRFLQTCHSYNESATISFTVNFQFLVLVVSRTLVRQA